MVFVTTDPRARRPRRCCAATSDRFNPTFDGLTGDLRRDRRGSARRSDVEIEKGQKLAVRRATTSRTAPRSSACCPTARAPFVWTEGTSPAVRWPTDLGKILEDKVPGL